MKNKNIRKENTKKKASRPKSTSDIINISADGFKYCILYDNYEATIYRAAIAVYKAAERSWKTVLGPLSSSVKSEVEKLYF